MGLNAEGRDRSLGREEQLASLSALIERGLAGNGVPILIRGEAGIGKSTLLARAFAAARDHGIRTLQGAAREWTIEQPFAPILEAVAPLEHVGSGLDGVGSSAAVDHSPYEVIEYLRTVLERALLDGPLSLAIEDLHWADEETHALIRRLIGGMEAMPLALVMTSRPAPTDARIVRLVEEVSRRGGTIDLGPMRDEDAIAMVVERLGAPPGGRLRRMLRGAGGNPLFVGELLAALEEEDALRPADGTIEAMGSSVPPSLSRTILGRLRPLADQTIRTLQAAAVLGTSFDVTDLVAFTGRSAAEIGRDLRIALDLGILADRGRMSFRHDLVHGALYEDMPESIRRSLHAEAARVLERLGRHPSEVALHVRRSARVGDEAAVGRLRRAADAAMLSAPATAADLHEHALDIAGPTFPERYVIRAGLARALLLAGRIVEAERIITELLHERRGGPIERGLVADLSQVLIVRGRAHEITERLEEVARADDAEDGERARLLAYLAMVLVQPSGDAERAGHVAAEAREVARDAGDETAACLALVADAHRLSLRSGEAAMSAARAAVEMVEKSAIEDDVAVQALHVLGYVLALADPRESDAMLTAALRRAEDAGFRTLLPGIHAALGFNRTRRGDLDDAIADLETSTTIADEIGDDDTWMQRLWLAWIVLWRGDRPRAEHILMQWEEEAVGDADIETVAFASMMRARLLEEDDNPEQALERLLDALRGLRDEGMEALGLNLAVPIARLAVRLDREDMAEELLAFVAGVVMQDVRWTALEEAARAVIGRDPDLALRALERFRDGLGRGLPQRHGRIAEETALLLAEAGRGQEAVEILEEALEAWTHMGGDAEVKRIEGHLRGLGRRVRRSPRPASGWEALTETERRVADLVLERLLYREIADRLLMSRRTVETHVARIFRKLGVSSRWDLEKVAPDRRPRPRVESHVRGGP